MEGDERTGAKIIERALEEPVRQIAENAGFEGSVVVSEVKNQKVGYGFNAATEEYVDMIEAGIVDPVKVTRSALQNAASASAMLLTTEAGIVDIKEDAPAMPAGIDVYKRQDRDLSARCLWVWRLQRRLLLRQTFLLSV